MFGRYTMEQDATGIGISAAIGASDRTWPQRLYRMQVDACVIAGLLLRGGGYKSSIRFPVSEYWAIVIDGA